MPRPASLATGPERGTTGVPMLSVISPPSTSRVPAGFEQHPCSQCNCLILVSASTPEAPICRACARMAADSAFCEALNTLSTLRAGDAPFDVLSPAERAEQISSLLGDVSAPALVR